MSEIDRADRLLATLGFFESRALAQAAIAEGLVRVNGVVLSKASQKISALDQIEAERPHPYVSRGGLKLAHALSIFPVSVSERVCLDVGASTGGFTNVLLEAGAAKIYAVDVGHGQLHQRIASDPRVVSMEGRDARSLDPDEFDPKPDLIVCDASFIGLEKVIAHPLQCAALQTDLIALFKPQFQVGPKSVGKGGIVTDVEAVDAAKHKFLAWLNGTGWSVLDWTTSPISGGDGNREYLLHAQKRGVA